MSRLSKSDYTNVIETIQAIAALGPSPFNNQYGQLPDDIFGSLQTLFPTNTMTLDDLISLLNRGTRSGVFRRNNITANCPTGAGTQTSGSCDDGAAVVATTYLINQQMVYVNGANKVYADYFKVLLPPAVDRCSTATASQFEGGSGTSGNLAVTYTYSGYTWQP